MRVVLVLWSEPTFALHLETTGACTPNRPWIRSPLIVTAIITFHPGTKQWCMAVHVCCPTSNSLQCPTLLSSASSKISNRFPSCLFSIKRIYCLSFTHILSTYRMWLGSAGDINSDNGAVLYPERSLVIMYE